MSNSNWTTIESDPGVFTEMIERMGVEQVQVEEIISLTDDEFARVSPAYGLVFLFKWVSDLTSDGTPLTPEETDPDLFFAKQIVSNACATQALLSLLFNARDQVNLGNDLKSFGEFVRDFPADLKGESIGNNELIRTVHNSFARPEPIVIENSKSSSATDEKEDVYHFIAYVPFKDALYELDGLRAGPIRLCALEPGVSWLQTVKPHIEARIAKHAASETLFNLMALIRDRRLVINESLARAREAGDLAAVQMLEEDLQSEHEKRKAWTEENIRRKHNYIPFIVAALNLLAQRKKLKGLVKAAQVRAQAKLNG